MYARKLVVPIGNSGRNAVDCCKKADHQRERMHFLFLFSWFQSSCRTLRVVRLEARNRISGPALILHTQVSHIVICLDSAFLSWQQMRIHGVCILYYYVVTLTSFRLTHFVAPAMPPKFYCGVSTYT